MLGQVAGALQVGAHPQRGHHDPQVRRDRLLARQQGYRPGLQVVLKIVDLLVRRDHALGELQIGVEHGRRGAPDGRADQPGHLDKALADRVKFLVVRVPHGIPSLEYVRGSGWG